MVRLGIVGWILFGLATAAVESDAEESGGGGPAASSTATMQVGAPAPAGAHGGTRFKPSLAWISPFVVLLLCIAVLPLMHGAGHWWHHNSNKLNVAFALSAVTLAYYVLRGEGVAHGEHVTPPGTDCVKAVLHHAVLDEYVPFMVLLFSLYTICGGIHLSGDMPATPATNTTFLGLGALLASFVGTTGASMLLIRPVLQTNRERQNVRHTVIFFIFLVSNIGGCLLPIGDPPLFLGYLRGVPFLWTFQLWKPWLTAVAALLVAYYAWDSRLFRKETPLDRLLDKTHREPMRVRGALNLLWLLGVVLAVALMVPGEKFLGRYFIVPNYLREICQLVFVGLAWMTTAEENRQRNDFNFSAIIEVAALFIGIFITMQVPIEILQASGEELSRVVNQPYMFFWMTGALSSFLDNAPTYAVFFEMADSMTTADGPGVLTLLDGSYVRESWLVAVSLGAVFMGANTYIGNGPNFMVKSIAEQSNVQMPSFFGYMLYSLGILIPLFLLLTFIFFR
ncbi:MAG: sodium:proton antiporter [Planctomycetes bacterium]|nr:sodium:proton antiporter [Planctomycetota bacterium]